MAFPTCTSAESVSSAITCLKCVDKKTLLAAQVLLLSQLNNSSVDPATIRANTKCLECMSNEDLERMATVLWAELAVKKGKRTSWTAQTLDDAVKCFKCLDDHTLKAMRASLLCTYLGSV